MVRATVPSHLSPGSRKMPTRGTDSSAYEARRGSARVQRTERGFQAASDRTTSTRTMGCSAKWSNMLG